MPFSQGHALLIGIGAYRYAPQLSVPITARDAERLDATLQNSALCGYPADQVRRLSNADASRAAILGALDELAKTSEEDTVVIFYAGHGEYSPEGDYYLTTNDSQFQGEKVKDQTGVSQAELLEKLNAIPAKRLLLFFNACHAGELSPTSLGGGDDEELFGGQNLSLATTEAILATGEGRIVITACRPEQKSWIGQGDITIFAQAIVDGFSGQGYVSGQRGYIGAYDLYQHIYWTAKEKAAELSHTPMQEPELTVHKGVGPFPVALFKGSTSLGAFDGDQPPPADTASRTVDPARSRRMYTKITGDRSVVIGGDAKDNVIISGDNNVVQQAKGRNIAQATKGANATVNDRSIHTAFDQRNQTVGGSQTNIGGDMHVGGDFNQGGAPSGQPTPEAVIAQMRHLLVMLEENQKAEIVDEDTAIDVEGQIKKAANRAEKSEPDKASILEHLTRAKDFVENSAAAAGLIAAIQQTIQAVQQVF